MKILYLMRHAKSSWADPSLDDHDRPLNTRGKKTAPRMGKLIAQEKFPLDYILSSTARRARDTTLLMVKQSQYKGPVDFTRALYEAHHEDYFPISKKLSDRYQAVMLVGHNPAMERFFETITGQYEKMPTASLAQIELPIQHWKDLTKKTKGRLRRIGRPKELDT